MQKTVVKVPVVMQLEALECGAACLTMILAYHHKWIPLEQVRADCGVSKDGSNAKKVLQAARNYGLTASGYRMSVEALMEKKCFPCIIHWNFNHFVVLNGFSKGKAVLNDPGVGTRSVSMEEFDESFTGICLVMEPGENFVPSGKPKSIYSFAAKRLKGLGPAIAFSMIMGLIATLIGVINPVFSRIFIDRLLTQKNPEWASAFIVILLAFSVFQLIVSAVQTINSLRINGKMAAVGSSSFMWKLLHLPIDFFSQRMSGDIQARQISNGTIANTLIGVLSPLLLQGIMLIFYLVVMIRYSWLLSLVGIATSLINLLVSNLVAKKQINISRGMTRDVANLNSTTVSGIEMIETIKASGAERGFYNKWAGYQANLNAAEVEMAKTSTYYGIIPNVVTTIANDAVLILGVLLIFQGSFTVGMIMSFQGFLSSFMGPAMTFVSANQVIQQMRTEMERVEDVMEYPEDKVFLEEPLREDVEYKKLSGKIEIKDLSFGYSRLDPPFVEHFDLTLEPGKSVAIVGPSGCGKSTMSKLISGLFTPWEGEILFDGTPLSRIPKSVFKSSVGTVDQEAVLFEDTIANNIKMWDDSIDEAAMIKAAKDAQIHDDILQRAKGYQHCVIEGGKDFSGGQRQRMEIARVLAQNPSLIILDEATSALDAKTEYQVVKAIKERGMACVVIAHRLSTIRSCDQIIVMEHGSIVAKGTHKELMQSSSVYQELVTNE